MKRLQSPTSINTFLNCPRKYYLKYIKGLKEKPNIHLIRGLAVHSAIAKFRRQNPADPTGFKTHVKDIVDLFNWYWACQEKEILSLDLKDEILRGFYNESVEMLSGWYKRYMLFPSKGEKKIATEVKLFSDKHGVMGIIDAIHCEEGRTTLIDYKTSKKEEITRDIEVQLAIYTLLYKENYGALPDVLTIDFLKLNKALRFHADEEYIDYAANLCREIHERTASRDERDYPCLCGGRCESEFL